MKLTPEERAGRRASFRNMGPAGKAEYIWSYFKLPVLLGLVALLFLGSTVYRQLTKKEAVLYLGYLNVSPGEAAEARLEAGFLSATGENPKQAEVSPYRGLYLSDEPSVENHQYGYASRMKLMAAIEAKQLDLVLMNREAYDILSRNEYLLDLEDWLSGDPLYPLLEPRLTANTVVLEENAIEVALNEASEYHAVTEEAVNGLDVSAFPIFQEAALTDRVYLGVIANSPRLPAAARYLAYLAAE